MRKLFTHSFSQSLERLDSDSLYRYLVQRVDPHDAAQIVSKEISTNESRARQLLFDLQKPEVSLQQSVEIAQERKRILGYVERLQQVLAQLGATGIQLPIEGVVESFNNCSTENYDNCSPLNSMTATGSNNMETSQNKPNVVRTIPENSAISVDSKVLKKESKLPGWMVWLQVAIGLGIAGSLWTLFSSLGFAFMIFPVSVIMCLCLALIGCVSIGVGFFAALVDRKPNTIFLAQTYIGLFIADNVLNVLLATGTVSKAICASLIGGAWLLYLWRSKRLRQIFPDRSVMMTTKIWAGVAVILLISSYVVLYWYLN